MAELPERKKLTHIAVGYQKPSQHYEARCGNCRPFIVATPPRCEHVKSPIRMMDYCRKWQKKEN